MAAFWGRGTSGGGDVDCGGGGKTVAAFWGGGVGGGAGGAGQPPGSPPPYPVLPTPAAATATDPGISAAVTGIYLWRCLFVGGLVCSGGCCRGVTIPACGACARDGGGRAGWRGDGGRGVCSDGGASTDGGVAGMTCRGGTCIVRSPAGSACGGAPAPASGSGTRCTVGTCVAVPPVVGSACGAADDCDGGWDCRRGWRVAVSAAGGVCGRRSRPVFRTGPGFVCGRYVAVSPVGGACGWASSAVCGVHFRCDGNTCVTDSR